MTGWVGAQASVRGERHRRREEPNEDHGVVVEGEDGLVVAIADGHGSPRCPRAATGAAFATAAAVEVLLRTSVDDGLACALVRAWQRRVDDDLDRSPPSRIERGLVDHAVRVLYGTTLLAACVSAEGLVIAQLGDGDVLLGHRQRPTAADRPFADETPRTPTVTHGLSTDNAIDLVKVGRVELTGTEVDVVLLCTDGLDFAFADADWHDPAMADLLARLPGLDRSHLGDELHRWCEPPARVGGDDTTIAIAVRDDLLAAPRSSET